MLEEYLELKYNNLISAINQTRYMDNIIKELKQMVNETEEMIGGCNNNPLFVATLRTVRDNLISAINQARYDRGERKWNKNITKGY